MPRKSTANTRPMPTFDLLLDNGKRIKGELYPGLAPESAGNFIELANAGYYDGAQVHHVFPHLLIEIDRTDCKLPYCIRGECELNNYVTGKSGDVTYGSLMMSRSVHYNSGSSGFFIVLSSNPDELKLMQGAYALFGQALEGVQYAHALSMAASDAQGVPDKPVSIKELRVETHGYEYPFEKLSPPQSFFNDTYEEGNNPDQMN